MVSKYFFHNLAINTVNTKQMFLAIFRKRFQNKLTSNLLIIKHFKKIIVFNYLVTSWREFYVRRLLYKF